MDCQIIILAAGNGTRMGEGLPKVMHKVGGEPMVVRVLANSKQVTNDLILVHSRQLEKYISPYEKLCKFVLQENPYGTADAVYSALELIDDKKTVAVLYGDNPFIVPKIINNLLDYLTFSNSCMTTLCFRRSNPAEYGRIITDEDGNFVKIAEYKEATPEELSVTLCNSGIMAFKPGILKKYLSHIMLNHLDKSKELYLTKIIEIARNEGEELSYFLADNEDLVLGVNTKQELAYANMIFERDLYAM